MSQEKEVQAQSASAQKSHRETDVYTCRHGDRSEDVTTNRRTRNFPPSSSSASPSHARLPS